ncbi:MAG: CvpA family protein [Alphaproteobacteria bacterium]|nr:CvpA family protein [Alphaproteobacteria bacterium]
MIVDILVGAVLLVSAIIAFVRGFIREVLTIAGVVGGLAAAYALGGFFSPVVLGWLGGAGTEDEPNLLFDVVPYPILAQVIAYGAIFIIVMILISVASHFLAEGVKNIGLGAIDRTLGVFFGLARGILLLGLLYLPVHMLIEKDTKARWFENSHAHIYLEKTAEVIAKFIPSDTVEGMEEDTNTVGDAISTRKKLEEMKLLRKKAEEGTLSEEDEKKL